MNEELELSYLAGLFDGEGCILVYKAKSKQQYHARLQVMITYYPTLLDFQRYFGGNLSKAGNNGKQVYSWYVEGTSNVLMICKSLLPYLREKKVQAEVMIEYCEKFPNKGNGKIWRYERGQREWYFQKLKALKREESVIDFPPMPEVKEKQLMLF